LFLMYKKQRVFTPPRNVRNLFNESYFHMVEDNIFAIFKTHVPIIFVYRTIYDRIYI